MATLSVLVITYNHAKYLRQCLDGILSQKTKHAVKIHIVEDCSTDGTQVIIEEYVKRYPDQITAAMNQKNRGRSEGIQGQVYRGFCELDGDYFALIEGDDYWSDDSKIDRQMDFLEENPLYFASSHHCMKFYDGSDKESHHMHYTPPGDYSMADLVSMTCFFHITSLVFRKIEDERLLRAFRHIENNYCCEIFVAMLFLRAGNLHHMDRVMSAYRAHAGGLFSNMSELKGRLFNIRGLVRYNFWLGLRYAKPFSFTVYRLCDDIMRRSEVGLLPRLGFKERLTVTFYKIIHGLVYDVIDTFPRLDPAVLAYGEHPKPSEPRKELIERYVRFTLKEIEDFNQRSGVGP